MNWDALGAVSEIVGAAGVVITLIFLVVQLKQNTRAMQESNRLERAAAIDRHTDSVGSWRSMLAQNRELAEIYLKATNNESLDKLEWMRLNHIWINLVNTQRSNFERAKVVGEAGLATQAVRSVAREVVSSAVLQSMWEVAKPWHKLASPDFVEVVTEEITFLSRRSGEFLSGMEQHRPKIQSNES